MRLSFPRPRRKRALIAGWFSFPKGGATAGDVEVCDVVRTWLEEEGLASDTALAPPLTGGVDWRTARPGRYSHVVVACGPVWPKSAFDPLLARFRGCRTVGVNVSLTSGDSPFDAVVERDGRGPARPDLSLGVDVPRVPVVGLLRVHDQPEYGGRTRHGLVEEIIGEVVGRVGVASVSLSTELTDAQGGMATAGAVESVIARMDAVLTVRMHGLVLALKHGVPAVAIDQVAGGAKVAAQAAVLGWPYVHVADSLDADAVEESLRACLEPEAKSLARRCAAEGRELIPLVRSEFVDALG